MVHILKTRSVHSGRLERYLGDAKCEELSGLMKNWYAKPIALHGVPGAVYVGKDGDFVGTFREGWETNFIDRAVIIKNRMARAMRIATRENQNKLNAGFASLSDLIAEATGGKKQTISYQKTGPTGVASVTSSLWRLGSAPAAGTTPSAAPGGNAPTSATTGSLVYSNAGSGDTLHLVSSTGVATVAGMSLLLYDRIFHVAKTINSTATEAVTGAPTRYQSTTGGAADSAEGNFLFVEVGGTALAATAHNWTVCTYTDHAGNAATLPSLTGNSGAIVDRLDHPAGQWFAPLAAGDSGIRTLTQMQCSAAVATGAVNFVIGHPIAWMVHPLANQVVVMDYVNTAFNLERIFDDACLAFLEPMKNATTATTFSGIINVVSG
ncbi:MAG: hypothetical protein ACKO0Z_07270 [Betaproteobacteria bacterium]